MHFKVTYPGPDYPTGKLGNCLGAQRLTGALQEMKNSQFHFSGFHLFAFGKAIAVYVLFTERVNAGNLVLTVICRRLIEASSVPFVVYNCCRLPLMSDGRRAAPHTRKSLSVYFAALPLDGQREQMLVKLLPYHIMLFTKLCLV